MDRLHYKGYMYHCHLEFYQDGKIAMVIPFADPMSNIELWLIGKTILETTHEITKFDAMLHKLKRQPNYRDKDSQTKEQAPARQKRVYPDYIRLVR